MTGAGSPVLPPMVPGVDGRSSPPPAFGRSISLPLPGVPGGLLGTEGISNSGAAGARGGIEDVRDGCSDSSKVDWWANWRLRRSASSGTSSTDACRGFKACSATDSSNACTSGSLGGTTSSSSFGAGFVALGSSPALKAFTIRIAWYLANLILPAISESSSPQI
jgi:hypothetical protein